MSRGVEDSGPIEVLDIDPAWVEEETSLSQGMLPDDEVSLDREVDALARPLPVAAALILAARARLALDLDGDSKTADQALARAAEVAPGARFVAMTRRWIAERRGTPDALRAALAAELPLTGDPAERAALLWESAAIDLFGAKRPEEAERVLRQIVAQQPRDLAAWLTLAILAMRRRDFGPAVEAWEATAAATSDGGARSAILAAAAAVRDARLLDVAGAEATAARALEADRAGAAAYATASSLLLRRRSWWEYARLLSLEAEEIGELEPALGCHEQAGDVYRETVGDTAAAAQCYDRAATLATDKLPALEKLAGLYEADGRHEDAARVYGRLLLHLKPPLARAAVLLRLGALQEQRLGRPEEAVRCYKESLETAPSFTPAAEALAALYRAEKRWPELNDLLRVEADRVRDPAKRAARYAALAELVESELGRTDEAVLLYEWALALDPSQWTTFDALDRIYRAQERWTPLIALYEAQLDHAVDPARVRALHLALAALEHDHAGSPERAAPHYEAGLDRPDAFPALASLARALAETNRWAEHVEALERQLELLSDDGEIVAMTYRIAHVLEMRLDDVPRALEAYRRVLSRAPKHEMALWGLLRLERRESRPEAVLAAERRLLDLDPSPEEAATTLHRIGQLAEEQMGRPDDAIEAYDEALARLPSHLPARMALERLLRARGNHQRLAALYERLAEAESEAPEKARLLCQAAALLEWHTVGDRARELYEKALALSPSASAALWGLVRIRESKADWTSLSDLLRALADRATHPKAKTRLLTRLGRAEELQGNGLKRAAERYEEAFSIDPNPATVLERLRVALVAGDEKVIPRWLERAATDTTDRNLAVAFLHVRAWAAELAGDLRVAVHSWSAAVGLARDDVQAAEGLVRSLARKSNKGLGSPLADRARLLRDPPSRAVALVVAGALHERDDDLHQALDAYTEASVAASAYLPALLGLRRLRQRAGDLDEAADLSARAAAACRDSLNAARLQEDAGDLRLERLGDPLGALRHYRASLAAEPARPRALACALQILEGSRQWEEAANLLGAQAKSVRDETLRGRLLGRRARLFADCLGDIPRAIADAERAVKLMAPSVELLTLLARLHESARHWADAARVYDTLAGLASGSDRRAPLLAQARIWTEHVPDPGRARPLLEEAVRLDPNDRAVVAKLADVALRLGDKALAAAQYRRLAAAGTPTERALAYFSLADVQVGMDASASADSLRNAIALAPGDPQVVPLLEERFRRLDLTVYVELAERVLAESDRDAPGMLALRLSVAGVLQRDLADADRAQRHLHIAVERHPEASEAHFARARLLASKDAEAAAHELRRVIDQDPTEPKTYEQLRDMCERQGMEGAAALLSTVVMVLMGGELPANARRTLAATPQPIAGSLPPADALARMVGETRAGALRRLMALLEPFLPAIFAGFYERPADAVPLPETFPSASVVHAIGRAVGADAIALYRGSVNGRSFVLGTPPSLVLRTDDTHPEQLTRLRFEAARVLSRVAGGSAVGLAIDAGLIRVLLDVATSPTDEGPNHRELRKRLGSVLPRRIRKELERLVLEDVGDRPVTEWSAWESEEQHRALGVGVLFARDLRAVVVSVAPEVMAVPVRDRRALVAQNAFLVQALRFCASEICWSLGGRVFGSR